uniref:NADH-ubiquinone oxidoreductase chain 3 n=1 Tax=Abronia graminea TaxID=278977 RepID=Q6I7V4_ABRGR|nr:NADH dehydrogenase subunit 3 [Abronia graminea]BAD24770.1 NADH dehydrogenase subunit 3 [Abronia graminea]
MTILLMIVLSFIISTALITLAFWLPMPNSNSEKLSPYECGFDPQGTARLPFSSRFFLVAILFLLFDLEIALLLPIPWAANLMPPSSTMTWATIILAHLTAGLVYEWHQGGLEWAE